MAATSPFWLRYRRETRPRQWAGRIRWVAAAALMVAAAPVAQVRPTLLLVHGTALASYIERLFVLENGGFVLFHPCDWFWALPHWLALLGETIVMAYLATVMGVIGALGLSVAASRCLSPSAMCFATRRLLEFFRIVPDIVFAIIFVAAFGLGPLPGVLAIAIHSCGALGKLFSDQIEASDALPRESIAACGGSLLSVWRFGVLPQVAGKFIAYTLLRFEINIRQASVLGLVGAGGIGQELLTAIRSFYYSDVSAILLLLLVTVFLCNFLAHGAQRLLLDAGHGHSNALLANAVTLAAFSLVVLGWMALPIDWSGLGAAMARLDRFVGLLWPPRLEAMADLRSYLAALGETVSIGFLGTVLGAVVALPLSFLAVSFCMPLGVVRFGMRRLFDIARSMDPLIYALIWIGVVGLGPFAGVLAIMTAEIGYLGKLFSEELDISSKQASQAVVAAGAPVLLVFRFGLLPQAFAVMARNFLYQFESNVRSATVIGIVGAGGFGSYFFDLAKANDWPAVCFLILLLWCAIAAMFSAANAGWMQARYDRRCGDRFADDIRVH